MTVPTSLGVKGAKTEAATMAVADRWEGMPAGECPCSGALIWVMCGGAWEVRHADLERATLCQYALREVPRQVIGS